MSLDAKFALKIDGGLVLEICVHPSTNPDAVADMLQDAVFSFRDGLTLMTAGTGLDAIGRNDPQPVEWLYFNYEPQTFVADPPADATTIAASDTDSELSATGKPSFYGEQPLIGETTYSVNGVPSVKLNYHPAMGISEIACILEDAAKDLRQELASRQPVQYDARTVSLTVPATRVGQHILNQLNSYNSKFEMALLAEDDEAAEKFFAISEKFYDWIHRNYTPEAIKNSSELQQTHRLETFKGIRLAPLIEEEPTNDAAH